MRRASVFSGHFTLEDLEAVCTSDEVPAGEALDLLASLVDKSLVVRLDVRGRACFRLHETMREYGRLKLRDAGETEEFERRCADYYSSRCTSAGGQARFRLEEWLEWTELEIDNLRAVLSGFVARDDQQAGLALAVGLSWYWITRANGEGVHWFDEFLGSGRVISALSGWAFFQRGFLSLLRADTAAARPWLGRAVAAGRETGQPSLLAHSLAMTAVAASVEGDRAAARRLIESAESVTDGLEDVTAVIGVLQARAIEGLCRTDSAAARAAAVEGARLGREQGDLYSLEMMLMNRGVAELIDGDFDRARAVMEEALGIGRRLDDRVGQAYLLGAFGCLAVAGGDATLAARLLGASDAMRMGAGLWMMAFFGPLLEQAKADARVALGAARYESERSAGTRLDRGEAIALALRERVEPRPAGVREAGLLGERELDVARLIAEGLSNKQIGARLFISGHTVSSHLQSIFNKLGFSSRSQLAAWMVESGGGRSP